MSDTNERKYIDDAGGESRTLIGNISTQRGTEAGICSVCLELSSTLIDGKCPKDATVAKPADGTVELLKERSTRNCWTPRQ